MAARDAIEAGRAVVFTVHARPCLYTAPGGSPVQATAKLHDKMGMLGEVKGTSVDYAEKEEPIQQVVFQDTVAFEPKRNGVIAFEKVGYRVDHTLPKHGAYIECKVARIMPAEFDPLPKPGDADWPLTLWE